MTKTELITNIHKLVSNNVIGDKQAMSRYKGFRGELFLESYMKENYPTRKYLEGGIIISKDSLETSLDNSIYISIVAEKEYSTDYLSIFKSLSSIRFEKMILVLYNEEKYEVKPVMIFPTETINLPVPEMTSYEYSASNENFINPVSNINEILNFFEPHSQRSRSRYKIEEQTHSWLKTNISEFSEQQLLKIYMNRLILDGFIGFGMKKGKPSDIDMIIKNSAGIFSLIEVKEKDLPKKHKRGFGLDVPRLQDMQRISEQSGLNYFLIVRHVNNQTERRLIGYKYISIKDFAADVNGSETVVGGHGMREESTVNETLICDYDLFGNL